MSLGHLTLSRHRGEEVIINLAALAPQKFIQLDEAQFILTVKEIKPHRVVFRFSSSTLIKIWRSEIWQKIAAQELRYRQQHHQPQSLWTY